MKKMFWLLGLALLAPPPHGNAAEWNPHVAQTHVLILDLQENPVKVAKAMARRWAGFGRQPTWAKDLASDLVALDVVAYFAELQAAMSDRAETPHHPAAVIHDRFFYQTLVPQQFVNSSEDFDSKAHTFAATLLGELNEREAMADRRGAPDLGSAKLIARLLQDGREFWIKHVMREVIERRVPMTADLQEYARVLPDRAYERFLAAVMMHHPDFKGSQSVIQELVGTRTENLQDVPMTGDRVCDAMLSIAIRGYN